MHTRSVASTVGMLLTTSMSAVARPQQQQATTHDHQTFICAVDGLRVNKSEGCLLLAHPVLAGLPDAPVYWHLTTFRSRDDADATKRKGDAVVEAAGRIWLSSLGALHDTTLGGTHVASIGPLPMPKGNPYQVELYYVIMPPQQHTAVHIHPGPEAWYILEGEQCLETPNGTSKVRAGQSLIGPPGETPMRLTNNGSSARRALFIVVHDSSKAWTTPSSWQPTGSCEARR